MGGVCTMTIQSTTDKVPGSFRLLLQAASRMRAGSLRMELPSGETLTFGGAKPGPEGVMIVKDYRLARRVLMQGDIGLAETYFMGQWDTPNLTAVLGVFSANVEELAQAFKGKLPAIALNMIRHVLHRNSKKGSRRNILAHYDLGNDFYQRWLDGSMTYSSARFDEEAQSLEAAQARKYQMLAENLALKPGQHVLEIGCGWGGFAEYAAREYGVKVTGVTISDAQYAFATERMKKAGLSDRVEILLRDYRDIEGQFDAVASIEMFEAVGERYWPTYFEKIAQVLKPGGRANLQIITIRDELFESYRRRADFIQHRLHQFGRFGSGQTNLPEHRFRKISPCYSLSSHDSPPSFVFVIVKPDRRLLPLFELVKRLFKVTYSTDDLPAQQNCTPGEATTHTFQHQPVAALDAPVPDGSIQRQRNRGCRRIAVAIHRRDDLVHRQAEFLRRRLDDADIGLMRDQPVDVRGGAACLAQRGTGGLFQHPHRELEYRLAIHLQQRIAQHRAARDMPWHAEDAHMAAIGVQVGGEDAGLLGRLQHHGAGAVTEQHAGGAILPVENARERLGADQQCARKGTGPQQAVDGRDTVDKAGADRLQIECGTPVDAESRLHAHRTRGKGIVGGRGRKHDQIDRLRVHAGRSERGARRVGRHVRRHLAFRGDVPLANAGSLHDPIVGGVDHLRQLGVGEQPARQIAAAAEHDRAQVRHDATPPTARGSTASR